MKKFFKLFFSRFALVAIAIILQVALIVVINYYLVSSDKGNSNL